MLKQQLEIPFDSHHELYAMLVPKDNELRRLAEICDYSFIRSELASKYSEFMGRTAEDPVRLFKYLVLKMYSGLSDVDVVKHSLYDLSFKYFLGLAPEETDLINPSTLSKFRRLRLVDRNLFQMLMSKTLEVAKCRGVKLSGALIVDSTHTEACYGMHKPVEVLRMHKKNLLAALRKIGAEQCIPDLAERASAGDDLMAEVECCQRLCEHLRRQKCLEGVLAVQERMRNIDEDLEDLAEEGEIALDKDARIGHKSQAHTFNGYKTHIGMDRDSRLITACVVTSGEAADGPQLDALVEQTRQAGMEVESVTGDTAYSLTDNLEACRERGITLYSKLHPVISNGTRKDDRGFFLNKDSGMMVCPQGHQSARKTRATFHPSYKGKVYSRMRMIYYFDVEKCKRCPQRDGCYSGGKGKSYSVAIQKGIHKEHREFQQSEEFRLNYRERYRIEAKNGELKTVYNYGKAESFGLQRMQLQCAVSVFTCNLRRILRITR